MRIVIYFAGFFFCFLYSSTLAQNGLFIDNVDLTVQQGVELVIKNDIHLKGGELNNQGNLTVGGDWILERATSRMTGRGTVVFKNSKKNFRLTQSIVCLQGNMNGPRSFFNLELRGNASGTLNLVALEGGNIEVSNSLVFNPNTRLRTSPNTGGLDGEDPIQYPHYILLSSPTSGAIVNPGIPGSMSGFIEGRLRRTVSSGITATFPIGIDPIGRAASGCQLMEMTPTGGLGGVVEASFTRSSNIVQVFQTQCNGVVDCGVNHGYWNLDLISGSVPSFDLIAMGANEVSKCPASSGDYVIMYRPGNQSLSTFLYSPTNGNICGPSNWSPSFTQVPRTGLTTFADFSIGRFMNPLPISLMELRAFPKSDHIKIEWATSHEINASHFDLERSSDGNLFQKITTLSAVGNASTPALYTYDDFQLQANLKYYYRLQMYDVDGNSSFSTVVESLLPKGLKETITIFPNPFKDDIHVNIVALKEGPCSFSVYDFMGRMVQEKKEILQAGENSIELDMGKVVEGHYILIVKTESSERKQKLLKRN